MANTNDFLPFAQGVGADVVDQPTYAAAPWVGTGFANGIAIPAQLNKVWRQSSTMAYVIAQFIVSELSQDVLDNASPNAIVAQFAAAIQQAAIIKPAPRIITASVNIVANLTDATIVFNRTAGVAAFNLTLANGMQPGQQLKMQDIVGNLLGAPVTIIPPAGQISGLANYVMNEDKQTAIIEYYGSNVYGVQS